MKEIPSISSSIIEQALAVNKRSFPWLKAFSAGLAASLPILIGLLLGNFIEEFPSIQKEILNLQKGLQTID